MLKTKGLGLVQADLLTVSAGEAPEYQPARPLEKISAAEILTALRNDGAGHAEHRSDGRGSQGIDRSDGRGLGLEAGGRPSRR